MTRVYDQACECQGLIRSFVWGECFLEEKEARFRESTVRKKTKTEIELTEYECLQFTSPSSTYRFKINSSIYFNEPIRIKNESARNHHWVTANNRYCGRWFWLVSENNQPRNNVSPKQYNNNDNNFSIFPVQKVCSTRDLNIFTDRFTIHDTYPNTYEIMDKISVKHFSFFGFTKSSFIHLWRLLVSRNLSAIVQLSK